MGNLCIRASALLLGMAPVVAQAQEAPAGGSQSIEDRLRALEANQSRLEDELRARDARIEELEGQRAATAASAPASVGGAAPGVITAEGMAQAAGTPPVSPASGGALSSFGKPAEEARWGTYEGGKGLVVARTDQGELDFATFAYARYLNGKDLDKTYTDSFGRTSNIDRRHDVQLQKITLNFKGWLFDPNFRYLFYAWTSNTNQGLGAQVVLGGYLSYRFNDAISVAAGIGSLPSTRTTNWNFPNWLRVDNRTMADEFFRASYTSGIWAWGEIAPGLKYRAMIGNNLSQLGVDATQLDNGFNTLSGALWWMPTTGEYGPAEGFGDFEHHDDIATLFGVHMTHSREDAQSQPGTESFENSQIRLSDGTLLFGADPFMTGGRVRKATYDMLAVNAGFKYRGFSLDGEYYFRWISDLDTVGVVPVSKLYDNGFQLQGSAMVIPEKLQAYASGSMIFGQYGDPWDLGLGLNWYPFDRREVRLNAQALYMDKSAIGYTSVPYAVGGKGWVFSTDVVLAF
ncbi:hypothetical protein [Novosphingobium sp. AP12]|uniref:hypothetical protein n=1 Tax=Novosphingobium sp. AP12 TaxID=1144305 RepID=UPI0002720B40|nr:hypothetical protein [Novosphingobium sp. AP12]EJL22622.1 hypothetical protein PMI02_04518 [Novosphingobium sp. AP12]